MRRVNTGDPDKLAYKEGGGCVSFFGLPFFAAGLFVIYAALAGQMTGKGGQPAALGGQILCAVFGLIFATVGAAFLFGRSGLLFDKNTKTVRRWYGLLFPMWSRSYDIKLFQEVSLSKEVRRNKNSTYTVYPVRLAGAKASPLDICQPQDELQARKLAEEIAKFINCDMVSGLGGVTLRREAGTLDESLRERLKRTTKDVDITVPPEGLRAQFSARGNAVFFTIPPPPFSAALLVPIGCGGIFAVFVGLTFLWPMLADKTMPAETRLLFGAFLGIFFIFLPLATAIGAAVSRLKRTTLVEVDSYSLRVTNQGALFRKHVEIPSGELEELQLEEIQGRYCLAAVSDKLLARFGDGLSRPELEWIRDVALKALTA